MRCPRAPVVLLVPFVILGLPCRASRADHWAFVPPNRPTLPAVSAPDWLRTPVDAFVLAGLDARGLMPSRPATPERWLRRVSLDLVGLPPSLGELDAFLEDAAATSDEAARERVIDRLLASPAFGEHWARPWLDLARYADSNGYQRDGFRTVWPYRDWVVRALNDDLPYDRFVRDQVAGDLDPGGDLDAAVATGFQRGTPVNVEAGTNPEVDRIHQVADRVNVTATAFLGLTLDCAQCHDHKYDPITQREYYALFAYFNSTPIESRYRGSDAAALDFVDGPAVTVPGPGGEMCETLVLRELETPRTTRFLVRGDPLSPGDIVEPGVPAVFHPLREDAPANRLALAEWLTDERQPLVARVAVNRWWAEIFGRGIVATLEDLGTRGAAPTHPELLDWLAVELTESGWSMKHVLRRIVLSATYAQSSAQGPEDRARDPENVWLSRGPRFRLAAETMRDVALAVSGRLARTLGGPPVRPPQPANFWRVTGLVDNSYEAAIGADRYRRGLYTIWRRSAHYPSFANFDAPNRAACVVQRARTNTPLQALTLLNDPVWVELAMAFARHTADRVVERGLAIEDGIRHAWREALARWPTDRELTVLHHLFRTARAEARETLPEGARSADDAAWFAVASAIFNLGEFVTK